jgi:arylsulfatase
MLQATVCGVVLGMAFAAATRPNILFMMADQMRWDTLTGANTPNLMQLAARGVRFSNMYSTTPTCTPARSALLTGLRPWYHGMLGYADVAPYYPYEMPREMAAVGYAAASVGKNHYYNADYMPNATSPPPSHGWQQQFLYDGLGNGMTTQEVDTYDDWFAKVSGGEDPLRTGEPLMDWNSWNGAPYVYEEAWHPTAWVGATARAWLANHSTNGGDAPFFLKVGTPTRHADVALSCHHGTWLWECRWFRKPSRMWLA